MSLLRMLPGEGTAPEPPSPCEARVVRAAICSEEFVTELNRAYSTTYVGGIARSNFSLIMHLNSELRQRAEAANIPRRPEQPELALRAAKFMPSFRAFLAQALGPPRLVGGRNSLSDWERLMPPEKFRGALFWEQINWTLGFERPTSVVKFVELLNASSAKAGGTVVGAVERVRTTNSKKLRVLADEDMLQLVEVRGRLESFDKLFAGGPVDRSIIRRMTDLLGVFNPDQVAYDWMYRSTEFDQKVAEFVDLGVKLFPRDGFEERRYWESQEANIEFSLYTDYSDLELFEENDNGAGNLIPLANPDDDISKKSVAERLAMVEQYARSSADRSLADYILEVFPELVVIEERRRTDLLPTAAPARWIRDKKEGDTPPDFIKRHYSPWLGKGLTRADIRRLDFQLYNALANWMRNNELPADFDLPTLKEQNDRWITRIETGEETATIRSAKDATNLARAIQRRKSSTKTVD